MARVFAAPSSAFLNSSSGVVRSELTPVEVIPRDISLTHERLKLNKPWLGHGYGMTGASFSRHVSIGGSMLN